MRYLKKILIYSREFIIYLLFFLKIKFVLNNLSRKKIMRDFERFKKCFFMWLFWQVRSLPENFLKYHFPKTKYTLSIIIVWFEWVNISK
jgi:hypothetical protein